MKPQCNISQQNRLPIVDCRLQIWPPKLSRQQSEIGNSQSAITTAAVVYFRRGSCTPIQGVPSITFPSRMGGQKVCDRRGGCDLGRGRLRRHDWKWSKPE